MEPRATWDYPQWGRCSSLLCSQHEVLQRLGRRGLNRGPGLGSMTSASLS